MVQGESARFRGGDDCQRPGAGAGKLARKHLRLTESSRTTRRPRLLDCIGYMRRKRDWCGHRGKWMAAAQAEAGLRLRWATPRRAEPVRHVDDLAAVSSGWGGHRWCQQ